LGLDLSQLRESGEQQLGVPAVARRHLSQEGGHLRIRLDLAPPPEPLGARPLHPQVVADQTGRLEQAGPRRRRVHPSKDRSETSWVGSAVRWVTTTVTRAPSNAPGGTSCWPTHGSWHAWTPI